MITKLKSELKKDKWYKVYFMLPRTINVNGAKYRIYKDYVWRQKIIIWDGYHGWVNEWFYSLSEPPKECL